jgi:hypothetical protein
MSIEYDGYNRLGGKSALIPQLTHTFAGNTAFYAAVPEPYRDYYFRFIKQYFQWYDGFVPSFHNHHHGIFSTRVAYTVLHKLAEQTTGARILFEDNGENGEALRFMEEFSKTRGLSNKITQATEWAFAGGDSLLQANVRGGEIYVDTIRKDNYFLNTDFGGNITQVSILLYTYTDTTPDKQAKRLFYLLEERKYDEKTGKPMERLTLKEGQGDRITYKSVNFHSGDIDFKSLPRNIRERLVKEYPGVTFGEWFELPFKSLGVYLVKTTEKVSFAPSLPFGESLLSNNIHVLMSYDFYYSAFMTDVYMGRGKVLMPRQMQGPQNDHMAYGDSFRGLDEFLLQRIDYVSPEEQKPIPIQFDLRSNDWKEIRNQLLQTMATNIGISERSIATYLVPSSEKPTAYEISSDENATASFVENKRPHIEKAVNELIDCVLDFYNYTDTSVVSKFSKIGLTNFNNVVNQVAILKQNGLIDERNALSMIFPDKNENQIDAIQEALSKERAEKQTIAQAKEIKTNEIEAHEDIARSGINTVPNPEKDG